MKKRYVIKSKLPDLNTYINAERSNKYAGAKLKKTATDSIAWEIKSQKVKKKFDKFYVGIYYYCSNKRIDKDNHAFKKKFLFDGMKLAGLIVDDGWKNVNDWDEYFLIDKNNPRIEFEISED